MRESVCDSERERVRLKYMVESRCERGSNRDSTRGRRAGEGRRGGVPIAFHLLVHTPLRRFHSLSLNCEHSRVNIGKFSSELNAMLHRTPVMVAIVLLAVVSRLALVAEAQNSGSPWNSNDGYSCSGDYVNCYNEWHYNSCPSTCNNGNGCRKFMRVVLDADAVPFVARMQASG